MSKSKKYEDAILEAFLLRAIEAENQALQETPEEPLDEETDQRLRRLIQAAYRKDRVRRRVKRYTRRTFACLAVALTVSLTVVLNVKAMISRCFREGLFYEARYHGEPVCVFVGKDEAGKAKFACMRSITGSLRKDVYGSDKEYSFCYPPRNPGSRHVAVFEAPIDALSHATLQELEGWKWDGYRLSLGGTSHVALTAFLERHPEIRRVNLYMDNDLGGLKNARRIKSMLHEDRRFKHICVSVNPPRTGKDYNEKLLRIREQIQERQQPRRKKEAAVSI